MYFDISYNNLMAYFKKYNNYNKKTMTLKFNF